MVTVHSSQQAAGWTASCHHQPFPTREIPQGSKLVLSSTQSKLAPAAAAALTHATTRLIVASRIFAILASRLACMVAASPLLLLLMLRTQDLKPALVSAWRKEERTRANIKVRE